MAVYLIGRKLLVLDGHHGLAWGVVGQGDRDHAVGREADRTPLARTSQSAPLRANH
jgi:hypothetical protein